MKILMTYAHDFTNDTSTHSETDVRKRIVEIAKDNLNRFPYDEEMTNAIENEDASYIVKNWFRFTDGSEWMALDTLGYPRYDYGKAG